MLSVTFFLQHFVWSFMLYIKVMIVTMLKMTVDINYLAYSHPCPFSEFVPFFPPYPLLACLLSCCIKPRCFKLYCTAGASWVPVSRMLAHTASILWAMQIIVYLTDVPCIFHIATWLCLQWVKSFFFLSSSQQHAVSFTSQHPLLWPHTHMHISSTYHWNQWDWFSWG